MRDSRWKLPPIKIAPMSDHGGDLLLLGLIAAGVIYLLAKVIEKGIDGWDVAACLLVLQGIVGAIKDRWQQRSIDRMGQQLGQSTPQTDNPAGTPTDPVSVVEQSSKTLP